MTIEPQVIQWVMGLLGTGILAGLGFILRSLNNQNVSLYKHGEALAVLVATVKPAIDNVQRTDTMARTVDNHDGRIAALEASDTRIWAIYDAYTRTRSTAPDPVGGNRNG